MGMSTLIRNAQKNIENFERFKNEFKTQNVPIETSKWHVGFAETNTFNMKNFLNKQVVNKQNILPRNLTLEESNTMLFKNDFDKKNIEKNIDDKYK